MDVLQVGSVEAYFESALKDALEAARADLTESAQVYVVHLMAEFTRAERVYAGTDPGEKPIMALLLGRASESHPAEAARLYKHIGDCSLYHSGFFAEALERELVGVDYYVSVGGAAYKNAAGLVRPEHSAAVFEELSDQFELLVELLGAMSLHGVKSTREALSDGQLLELIERYRRTGRREVLEALAAKGVVLRPGLLKDDPEVH